MIDYNPVTHTWCQDCDFYRPVAQWIFQIEREPEKMCKCRYLPICNRVAKVTQRKQLSIDEIMEVSHERTPDQSR